MGTYCGRAWRLPVREENLETVKGLLDAAMNPPLELYQEETSRGAFIRELNTQFNWGCEYFPHWRRKEWVKEDDLHIFYCYSATKLTGPDARKIFIEQLRPLLEAPDGTILYREFGDDWYYENVSVVHRQQVFDVVGLPFLGYFGNKTAMAGKPAELYPSELWRIEAVEKEALRRRKEHDDAHPYGYNY